jgi:hypothetical protein
MRGRDRLFGTVAIWAAVAIMMNNLMDRFLRITADFSGLWPPLQYTYTLPDASFPPPDTIPNLTVDQLNEVVNRTGPQIVSQVNDIVARQMASSIPIMVILALALILAAILSTYFVWRHAHLEAAVPAPVRRGASAANVKSKRGSRVEQVVNALDDDEIAELRARLHEVDEDDAVPLETLLAARDESYRR